MINLVTSMTYNYNQSNKESEINNIDNTWTLVSTNKKASHRQHNSNIQNQATDSKMFTNTTKSTYPKSYHEPCSRQESGSGSEVWTEYESKTRMNDTSTYSYSSNNNRKKYRYDNNHDSRNTRNSKNTNDFRNIRDSRNTRDNKNMRYDNTNKTFRNKQHDGHREGINWSSQSIPTKRISCKYIIDNTS